MLRRNLNPRRLTHGDRLSFLPLCSRYQSSQIAPLSCCPRQAISCYQKPKRRQQHFKRFQRFHSSSLPSVGDTIYALSTAQGRAGIAVVRISGPSCRDIYGALCPGKTFPKPRLAAVRTLCRPGASPSKEAEILDSEALVLFFPGPKSVTGEDVIELHIHGGPATVKAVLSAIPRCTSTPQKRVRYAEPGEFTKRAFIHDRLDLAQVESLGDTLDAETEQQRRAAVRGNSGRLGRTYEGWREQLLLARGEIEALIDFSEDQHFDESQSDLLTSVTKQIDVMLSDIQLHEQGSQRRELLRNGIRIALLGPPNVGKSSLMNLVVGREASIVSGEAGTTRDIVEASLDVRGYLCSFADTAGFRSEATADQDGHGLNSGPIGAVEKEGIRRAKQKAQESDIIVVLASVEKGLDGHFILHDTETLDLASDAQASLIVVNKIDAVPEPRRTQLVDLFRRFVNDHNPELSATPILTVSCQEAQTPRLQESDPGGVQSFINNLVGSFAHMTEMPVDQQDLLGVTERQRQLLAECSGHLEAFMLEARPDEDEDRDADAVLAAEYLRYAADCLARITGRGEAGDVEDVLGVVFEKFCVGK